MPWKTQVGMVASELSRIDGLLGQGGGPEIQGCLDRARELLGVLESTSAAPIDAGVALNAVARSLSEARQDVTVTWARDLYGRLMALYQSQPSA